MAELKKNEIHRAVITGYSSEGAGVCRIDGRAVFVKGALAGEEIDVRILKATKTAVYGKIENIVCASPERCEPECGTFAKCGGCALMHMTYEEELRFKKEKVDAAIKRIGGIDMPTERINGAPSKEGYRNKAIYAVSDVSGKPVTGFFRQHTHDVIETERCLIQSEYSDRAAKAVREWMAEYKVPAYNEKTGSGAVRHVFSRYAFGTGQGQVTVVSYKNKLPNMEKLVEKILKNCPEELFTVIMRRFMVRVAEAVARKEECGALITGESLGQVASQTMQAIACTDAVANMPIFRPLIGTDKAEIIEIAKKIDTFEISIQPFEDCCTVFTPRHPRTKPPISVIEHAESALDVEGLVNECLETLKYTPIRPKRRGI